MHKFDREKEIKKYIEYKIQVLRRIGQTVVSFKSTFVFVLTTADYY